MIQGYEGKDRWRFRSVRMGSAPAFQDLQVLNQRALWRSWRALGSTMLPLPWDDAYTHRSTAKVEVAAEPFVPGSRGPWAPKRRADTIEELPAARALGAYDPMGAGGPTLAYIAHVAGDDPSTLVAKDHHAAAGDTVRKTALLINDEREAQAWSATWTAERDGQKVGSGEASGTLAIAARATVPIAVPVPADASRGELVITLDARIGQRPHTDRFVVQVYPRSAPATGSVLTVDPRGDSSKALTSLGYAVATWDGKPAPGAVVVVGRHALSDATARGLDYAAHIAAGGRVLVLAQERAWYEQDQGLRTSAWSSRRAFPVPTMTGHPVIAGLGASDLRDWNGAGSAVPARPAPVYEKESHNYPRHGWKWGNNGTVAGLAIEKPHHGGWRPLLQCEFDLAYSPLLELPAGQGLTMWCTLDLEGRSTSEPVADILLHRLVEHARSYAGEMPRQPAAWIGDTSRMSSLGLVGTAATGLPADYRPVVIGPDAAIDDATLRQWITGGGRALILVDATRSRLGFTTTSQAKHLGSLAPPAWPEARGLAVSDLRLRNQAAIPVLQAAPAEGEIAADGLLGRLALGSGVAIVTTIDPALLPISGQPWLRFSQWRWTRTLAQFAGNLGMQARGDGKAVLADLRRDAPRRLAGTWRMMLEKALPLATEDKPHAVTPVGDLSHLSADTSTWLPIPVPGAWETNQAQFDGAIWVRKQIDIPADWAGQKLVLELGTIDDHDTVWFNGQRIGGMGKENPDAWQTARSYSVKPEHVQAGKASIAIRVFDWFGGGGFSPEKPETMRLRRADNQGKPIALAGSWFGRIERSVVPAKGPGDLLDTGVAEFAKDWHLPTTDDAAWQPIRLPQSFEAAFADIDGAVWLRTTVEVPAHWAGRELELQLGKIGNAATVFVAGQQIGQGPGLPRYVVPAALAVAGPLDIAVRVFNTHGPGGLIGLAEELGLALPGDIAGAAWYESGYRTDFSTGDDPFRYYRW
jgi:beta-galactosidase